MTPEEIAKIFDVRPTPSGVVKNYPVELRAYSAAKTRCTNRKQNSFRYYGGRGIEFRFLSFHQWLDELGPRPSSKHSVDRIRVTGHYEPGNVRWATAKEQAFNKRKSGCLASFSLAELQEELNRRLSTLVTKPMLPI